MLAKIQWPITDGLVPRAESLFHGPERGMLQSGCNSIRSFAAFSWSAHPAFEQFVSVKKPYNVWNSTCSPSCLLMAATYSLFQSRCLSNSRNSPGSLLSRGSASFAGKPWIPHKRKPPDVAMPHAALGHGSVNRLVKIFCSQSLAGRRNGTQ